MAPRCSVKPDFQDAARRVQAWWNGSAIGRPAVICRVPRPGAPEATPDPRPRPQREMDPDFHAAQAEWLLDGHLFPAETMPGLFPSYGHSLVVPGALAGAKLQYRPETTWMEEIPGLYEGPLPELACEDPVLGMLKRSLRLLGERVGERGLLSAPPLLDGLTTLSMLRGVEALCVDLLERAEDVKRFSARLDEIALRAHAELFSTIGRFGHAQSITWAGIYAPGKCEMVQCDFAIMLSPEMFGEFVMPYLRAVTAYMDYSCYHLDGTPQTRFLDQLCTLPRLHAIQWNPEPPAPPPLQWLDFFREVRRRKRSLWIACDADTAIALTKALGPDGLMLSVHGLDTLDQVHQLLRRLANP